MQGRVYALITQDAQATDTMVAGILPLFSAHAKVLFYHGSTHSFVSCTFAKNHDYLILSYQFPPLLVIL